MRRINRARLDGQVEDLAPMVHPEIVMIFPVCWPDSGREDLWPGGLGGLFPSCHQPAERFQALEVIACMDGYAATSTVPSSF